MKSKCVIIALLVCPALLPAPGTGLKPLIAKIQSQAKPGEAMEYMRRVYSTDRWFTFPKFAETAEYLKRAMTRAGLRKVEIINAPADGTSQFGYWTMPMAWDVKQARLELIGNDVPAEFRILADYENVPASLGMWSGPTPPGGITADLIELKTDKPAEIEKLDLKGKLVLTSINPAGIKWVLARKGALGAVNTFTENPALPNGRQWINAWGDNGWAFNKKDSPLLCFSLSPKLTAFVRKRIAEHGSVRVKATVSTRYYQGTYPYVTGVIPGSGPGEEVMTLGHTAEQGAQDNATGVAAMLEAMGTLNRMIEAGQLPRPRRSIRMLAMGELYDSMHYLATNPDRVKRTIAALCLDTPAASYELPGTEYTFYLNPHVAKSYVDAFVVRLAQEYFGGIGRPSHWNEYRTGTDSFLGEPMIGIPTVWPYSGSGVETHHNSEDTPDRVDQRSLRDLTVITAVFTYYLASAGKPEAEWLAEVAESRGQEQIRAAAKEFLDSIPKAKTGEELGRILHNGPEKVAYMVDRESQSVRSVQRVASGVAVDMLIAKLRAAGEEQSGAIRRLVKQRAAASGVQPVAPPADPRLAEAAKIVVKRKRIGSIPLDELAPDKREGYPSSAWATIPQLALFWCDGHRNLAEVIRLTQQELGPTKFDFVGYFRFLRRHGYVEFQ